MNILDYIDWQGDLSFAASPLNEVDNLIFAKLSYLDLRGLAPEDFAGAVTLRALREAAREEPRSGSRLPLDRTRRTKSPRAGRKGPRRGDRVGWASAGIAAFSFAHVDQFEKKRN